jgi:hypothetical protein
VRELARQQQRSTNDEQGAEELHDVGYRPLPPFGRILANGAI